MFTEHTLILGFVVPCIQLVLFMKALYSKATNLSDGSDGPSSFVEISIRPRHLSPFNLKPESGLGPRKVSAFVVNNCLQPDSEEPNKATN